MSTKELSQEALAAINEEEQCLSNVLDSLHAQLSHSSTKLQSESRKARELTSEIVATFREEEKALLASDEAVAHAISHKKAADIEILQKQIDKPYFARFVLEEDSNGQTKQYEYKLGFSANPDARIIDWRKAPISKLYYDYREGDEYCEEIQGNERYGFVKLRNSVEIEDQQLMKLSCRYGNFFRDKNDTWQGSQARHPRHSGSRGTLPDVLSLITKEQFQTITEDSETAILIQGIAGSGKTTVALHRLAWLLHEDNSDLKAERCVVVVLSKILKAYVENFLPSIGVPGVNVLTYHDWTKKTITKICPDLIDADGDIKRPSTPAPLGVQRTLRSMALLTALEEWETDRLSKALQDITTKTDWNKIPSGIIKAFHSNQEAKKHPSEILQNLLNASIRGLQTFNPQHPMHVGIFDLHSRLTKIVTPSFFDSLIQILSNSEMIISYDETKLIDKDVVAETKTFVEALKNAHVLDYALDAIFIRLHRLRGGLLTLPDGSQGLLDHIVVDEAQDFSPMDLAIFIEGVKDKKQLTLVGDTSQNIYAGVDFPGWDKLMRHWKFKESLSKYVTLTVSHRSTLQIMRLAEYVQGRDLVTQGRPGRTPIWFKCYTEEKGFFEVVEWLNKAVQRYPTALTAVITATLQEAKVTASLLEPSFGQLVRLGDEHSFSFEEGIIVTDVLHSKGLEFVNVLLWNPTSRGYPSDQRGRNLLYTAMTRAEENLCIVTWSRPTNLLPPLNSKLVRGVNIVEEEEEKEEPLPDYNKYEYE
ncbi:MAG: UvrD-helicase domain-containing protein [Bdellovibrionota bacterium]|jgi:DNA helicase-2/ATP-dependent DNA helicase PcrA